MFLMIAGQIAATRRADMQNQAARSRRSRIMTGVARPTWQPPAPQPTAPQPTAAGTAPPLVPLVGSAHAWSEWRS